uniref:Fe2OG dioxygenase domain-containing protein n=2 Tax=Suricata suricatta TaxID=37032 RepID=A0A673UD42_SURSU
MVEVSLPQNRNNGQKLNYPCCFGCCIPSVFGLFHAPVDNKTDSALPVSHVAPTCVSCGLCPPLLLACGPQWHPVLLTLKDQIEKNTGHTFNSLLCNLYRNEKDSVDWHSDDEPSLGRCPVIASLSFGATRTFEMRRKPPPEENGDYTYVERVKIPLDHGTLLIMEGATQADWQHRVPKEYHSREPRINLTFRTVYPDPRGARW